MMKNTKTLRTIFSLILAAVLMFAALPLAASAASVGDFTDVKPGAWYYKAVQYALENGLFAGTSSSTFSPDTPMTRGMFVTVLARKTGVDPADYPGSRFTDVEPGKWYAPYVEWAAENGVVSGMGNGIFQPNSAITREQMTVILYRYAQKTGVDTTYDPGGICKFGDSGDVSSWSWESMDWSMANGIISGMAVQLDFGFKVTETYLRPQGTATRAQVAQVLYNAREILTGTAITNASAPSGPNNVFNVFTREYDPAMDNQVTAKSKVSPKLQAQLLELLEGKTGGLVWNEIALKGWTCGGVGYTRAEQYYDSQGSTWTVKAFTPEMLVENIVRDIETMGADAKYFCLTIGSGTDGGEVYHKDLYYNIYFINTPDAFVDASDSAFTAAVKRKVAERIPSGLVWSSRVYPDGGWTDFQYMPWNIGMTDAQLVDAYADFFVYMLLEGYGTGKVGAWTYYINKEPGSNNGHEALRLYVG